MPVCKECGKELKAINNTHLWYKHTMTMAQYAIKYDIDMAELVDPEIYILRAKSHKVNWENNSESRTADKENLIDEVWREKDSKLTEDERQVIYGTLLGDGYLFRGKALPNSTYLQIDHGVAQFAYLFWKYEMLYSLGPRITQNIKYLDTAQRVVSVTYLDTTSGYYYGKLARLFYNEKGKIVSDEILSKLDHLGVAVWLMDDGSREGNELAFNTQSFCVEDRKKLISFLNNKYDAKFYEADYAPGAIRCNFKYLEVFLRNVRPFVLPMFQYKLGKEKLNVLSTVVRRFKIDAAHFLEDYKGKCFCQHGHYYVVDIAVKGPIDPLTGMVVDFGYIKKIFTRYIDEVLDHKTINYVVPELRRRATAELMAVWMWKILVELLPGLSYIQLWEQPELSSTIYKGPSRDDFKRKREVDELFGWAESAWQQLLRDYPELQKRGDLYYSTVRSEKTGKLASIHWPEGVDKYEESLLLEEELRLRDTEQLVSREE